MYVSLWHGLLFAVLFKALQTPSSARTQSCWMFVEYCVGLVKPRVPNTTYFPSTHVFCGNNFHLPSLANNFDPSMFVVCCSCRRGATGLEPSSHPVVGPPPQSFPIRQNILIQPYLMPQDSARLGCWYLFAPILFETYSGFISPRLQR